MGSSATHLTWYDHLVVEWPNQVSESVPIALNCRRCVVGFSLAHGVVAAFPTRHRDDAPDPSVSHFRMLCQASIEVDALIDGQMIHNVPLHARDVQPCS